MEIKSSLPGINQESKESGLISDNKPGELDTEGTMTPQSSDHLTLTDTAANMVRLEEKLADVPEVNNQRVQAIRLAIDSGNYSVDTDSLVENLIRTDKEIN